MLQHSAFSLMSSHLTHVEICVSNAIAPEKDGLSNARPESSGDKTSGSKQLELIAKRVHISGSRSSASAADIWTTVDREDRIFNSSGFQQLVKCWIGPRTEILVNPTLYLSHKRPRSSSTSPIVSVSSIVKVLLFFSYSGVALLLLLIMFVLV